MVSIPKKVYTGLGIVVLGAGIFGFGMYAGYAHGSFVERVVGVDHKEVPATITNVDFEPFWKVWALLDQKSPDASKVSSQDRVWGAISGLVDSFDDPYTTFFPPTEKKSFEDAISGEFGGIGIEIGMKEKFLTVIAPIKDSPADKVGVKAGDVILKIGDEPTTNMTIDEAIHLLRGDKGTSVTITVAREGDEDTHEYTIVRGTIEIPTIKTEKRNEGIFIVSLYNFSANSASLFQKAVKEFSDSGDTKLIVDLRGNPGGYLEAAIDMASWFLPSGEVVVREDFGTSQPEKIHRSRGYDVFTDKLQMVVLVDGGSASASEILAGALQEHKIAKLIGEQTYGKGSVQELIDVTNDTAVKVTIAKWLTPNGVSISKAGLTPDIKVPFTKEDADKKIDPQLDRAVEFLKTGK